MFSMALVQARVDSASERLNQILVAQERKELARLEAEAAEQEREAAERARRHAERKREFQSRYADAYAVLNLETPMSQADELPSKYRRRLYDGLRRRLAPDHPLVGVRADELAYSQNAFANFERDLLQAAEQEALRPSEANLPPSGELLQRVRVDPDTGERSTVFFGKRSFIADLSRPGQKVERIVNPRSGDVLWGAPFPKAR
jgi:hypothetical protein